MATPIISIRDLTRKFISGEQEVTILKGISLDIHPGEMVAIIGQSGSGKSTLMNILGCLDRPSGGSYHINGRDVSQLDREERAALRREYFGFIFQRYHLLGGLTAWENVAIPAIYAGVGPGQRQRRAEELLTRLGLGDRINHRPSQLSGGQQQRVSIARALMNGSQVIFADEPTGALDTASGKEVMTILRELHQEGHTVVLVTHDRDIAAQADRIIEVRDGVVIRDERQRDNPACELKQERRRGGNSLFTRLPSAFAMALRAVYAHKMRAFLTMLGIIIGIASVVAMVALGNGAKAKIMEDMSDLGSNTIEIFPGKMGDPRSRRIRTLVPSDAEVLSQQDFIDSATPSVGASPALRYENRTFNVNLTGVGAQYFQVVNVPVSQGRTFNQQEVDSYAPVVVLDQSNVAEIFGKDKQPAEVIGEIIILKNVPVRVIGLADFSKQNRFSGGSISVYMPYTSAMNRVLGRSNLNGITVRVRDGYDPATAEDAIRRILIRRHGSEDFSFFNSDSIRKAVDATMNSLTMLISFIAAIALVVGGIGVMNIMLVSVTERTQEIGIRMAVGARPGDIMLQFLIEAIMLCLLGGLLGIGLAYGLGHLVNGAAGRERMIFSTNSVIIAFSCASAIGLIFGYMPARNAAQLDPVEALSRE